MAKEVRWSKSALADRRHIYEYWRYRNKSDIFSDKLDLLFKEVSTLIAAFPELGVQTDVNKLRMKVVRNFRLFYFDHSDHILIVRVWDTRQDPQKNPGKK
jgi:plasmid stabilization system protein ParE